MKHLRMLCQLLAIHDAQQAALAEIRAHNLKRVTWSVWHWDMYRIGLEQRYVEARNSLYELANLPFRWQALSYSARHHGGLLPSQWPIEGAALRRAALLTDESASQGLSFCWEWPAIFSPPSDESRAYLARALDPAHDDPDSIVILARLISPAPSGPLPDPDPELIRAAAELGLPFAGAIGTRRCGATSEVHPWALS